MLTLAVATRGETFERIRDPLRERDIGVEYLRTSGRTIPLWSDGAPWSPDDVDVGFVYPPRPMEGGAADALLDVPWVNDREAVLTSRNKGGVLAALSRAGVSVPRTVLVSNPVDESTLRRTFDRFDPPVVVKPNSTTRGVGVTRAFDLDSFLGIADYLALLHDFRATADRSFLVQEYVPDARDFRVMVLDGECVGVVERRLAGDARSAGRWKHNVHRGAVAIGASPPSDVVELAERTAAVLDVPFIGVDVLVTDERAIVSETNARPTIDAETKYDSDFYDRLADLVRQLA